jgi:hypothetical protein
MQSKKHHLIVLGGGLGLLFGQIVSYNLVSNHRIDHVVCTGKDLCVNRDAVGLEYAAALTEIKWDIEYDWRISNPNTFGDYNFVCNWYWRLVVGR